MNERYRIHQVITAAPGTRMMMKFTEDDATARWEAVPVLLFALLENLEHGGDRFVVPMDQSSGGLFEHSVETNFIGRVLAPGESVPADYDGE